jgi:hypothetical protein
MVQGMKAGLFALGMALVAAMATGCHKSAQAVCNDTCDKAGQCGAPADQVTACRNVCSQVGDTNNNCKNANDILDCAENCLNKACDQVQACAAACPQCQM